MALHERVTDCPECGDGCRELVYAVNVSDQTGPDGRGYGGEYQHILELDLSDGTEWVGEQCGDCGCGGYTIQRVGVGWSMVCTGDDIVEGCGRENPIVRVQSHYVVF